MTSDAGSGERARSIARDGEEIAGRLVRRGERCNTTLGVGQSFLGVSVEIPLHIWRAPEVGPTVLLTAAVHGDEINGTGALRSLLIEPRFQLQRGTLIVVPVVNVLGFERHSRYLPDRRDLNRSFPGSAVGSTAARMAHAVFDQLVRRSDFGIDLHTAAVRRANFPNVRGDMSDLGVARIAPAFGAEVVVDGKGPEGSLRREATDAGCPTIVLEAGEVSKVESTMVEYTLRGIRNVLIELGMIEGARDRAKVRSVVSSTTWIRAQAGGFLQFHVAPGELVEAGEPIATNTSLLGDVVEVLRSPVSGIVLGMTTLPAVAPGDAVAHVAVHSSRDVERIGRALDGLDDASLAARVRGNLATSVHATEHEDATDVVDDTVDDDEID